MPDLSRVSSIETERADDSSTNSYNSLGDCCLRFVSLEHVNPNYMLIVDYFSRYFEIDTKLHKEQHSNTLHEIHFCKTWDSERS